MKRINQLLPIRFTNSALSEITRLKDMESKEDNALRIGVKSGGCAGFSYVLEFDEIHEGDVTYEVNSVEFIIHENHLQYLNGSEIDFENGLNNRGFTFTNPNANDTCGCGTSFG